METASAFRAAKLMKKPLAAIFSVSHNTIVNKLLISRRTKDEKDYCRFVRGELLPKIILHQSEQTHVISIMFINHS